MRFVGSWVFYLIGDAAYHINDRLLYAVNERLWSKHLFHFYQWSMRTAYWMQGDGRGPWRDAE